MAIDDMRLLAGLRANIEELAKTATDPRNLALLKSSRTMLNELYRRHDRAAAAAYFERGHSLLRDAAASGIDHRTAQVAATLRQLPETLTSDAAPTDSAHLETLRRTLWNLLEGSGYPAVAGERHASLLKRLLAWEHEGYAVTEPKGAHAPASDDAVVVDSASLEHYLRRCRPGFEDARIVEFTALAGGFSKQTALFDVRTPGGFERLVYRGAPTIQIIDRVLVDIADEFHTVAYAYAQGAVVAEPLWLESDPAAMGTRFFISRRAPGINLGTAIQAHAPISSAATRSLAEALARIHGLALNSTQNDLLRRTHLRLPDRMPLQAVIRARIEDWQQYFISLGTGAYPTLELAFQWLKDNAAASGDDPVLVHGDYGLHNILVDDDRVQAVLDWEACHVGDRALDLSHLLTGTAGKMDADLFMSAYIAAGGRAVDDFRLKYYQVLMNMQFMLSTIHAQHIYQHRAEASTNYCTLGLGFIHYTATSVHNGILLANEARSARAGASS